MGKQNNTVKIAVPGFFGCSGVPLFRDVPGCSGVLGCSGLFRVVPGCSGVPVFRCSSVPCFSTCRFDYMIILARFEETGLGFSARAELRPGLNPSPCNRQFNFKRTCLRGQAEVSARADISAEIRHVIGP